MCSAAPACRCNGTARRRRRSPSGRATVSSTSPPSTGTRCSRAPTGSTCSPSASVTTRWAPRCCRGRASRGGSARGRGPRTRRTTPGSARPKRARRTCPSRRRAQSRIVHVDAVEPTDFGKTTVRSSWRDLGRAAGSQRTGLRHVTIEPGALMAPPHCHAAEEEIFVVLEGDGELDALAESALGRGA